MSAADRGSLLKGKGIIARWRDDCPDVVRGVDIEMRAGRITCVVGPNGAGKSTLLAALAGVLVPRSGTISIDGRDLNSISGAERARLVGYLPQSVQPSADYTVRELVSLGRYPHLKGLGFERDEDREAVAQAMRLARVEHLAARPFAEISGGERQRALIASILAQQPEVMLFDEPTAALDIGQRRAVFAVLRELAGKGTVIGVVTHDINLAAIFADEIALLIDGELGAWGSPKDVLTSGNLERAYEGFELVSRPGIDVPCVLPAIPENGR